MVTARRIPMEKVEMQQGLSAKAGSDTGEDGRKRVDDVRLIVMKSHSGIQRW
jgi:hypothetical protein